MTEQQRNDVWTYDQQPTQMKSAAILDSDGSTIGFVVGTGMDPKKSAEELARRIVADHNRGLLAAHAMQGEPVGEAGSLPGAKGFTTAVFDSIKVPEGTKLYTALQPAEQPECGCCGQTVKCDDDCDAVVLRKADQDSTPDVAALVNVLEDLVSEIENNTCLHENTYRRGIIWEFCEDCGEEWSDHTGGKPEFAWSTSVETARRLIHTHRKGKES